MDKHTKEPWILVEGGACEKEMLITTDDRHECCVIPIAEMDVIFDGEFGDEQLANARRIVACVNACAGVETETLEGIAGKGLFSLAIEAVNENEGLKKQCDQLNTKIDQAWGRSSYIALEGFIPGAFDAWKQPVKQFLPYDFSGNPGSSATQYCNGWNDAGGYWLNHARDLKQQHDELQAALEVLVGDISDRFDMDSPSTNPGMKDAVAAALAAIAKAKGGAE